MATATVAVPETGKVRRKPFSFAIWNRRVAIAVVSAIVVAIALPFGGALYLAHHTSVGAARARATLVTEGLLRQFERAASQALAAFAELSRSDLGEPCSPPSLDAIRSLEVSSTYLQALGYIEDSRLKCTGAGRSWGNSPLPTPSYTSTLGNHVRKDVWFSVIPGQRFVIADDSATGFAAVFHGNLGFDLLEHVPNLSAGVVSRSTNEVIAHLGHFEERWLDPRGSGDRYDVVAQGYAVSLVESSEFDFGVYAAVVVPPLEQQFLEAAYVFVPMGVGGATLLVGLVVMIARAQLSLPAVIRFALQQDEFHMVYQPVVDLHTRRWVGVEALIRWTRANGESIHPDVFVPAAEETGQITAITERVFDLVARDTASLAPRERFYVGINVSAADLQLERTVEMVRKHVAGSARSGPRIIVEATERGLMQPSRSRPILSEIRAAGAAVALDDFGTGYSSLSYLDSFELDYLKIDKSFVDTIGTESATSDIVSIIIQMAETLDLEVVAEGVETELQARYLAERGVRYAQGWLFAKPMAIEELTEALASEA
jgi:sensor c-di-GMP phosphodiesterase-like protein